MGARSTLSLVALLISIGLYFIYPQLSATFTSEMSPLSVVRASNAGIKHSTTSLPVAVFIGGTSGIGQGMAEVFANNTQGNSHIVIVGRNRDAAEKIFASFPKPSVEGATKEFVQCDATLMKNVDQAAKEVLKRHTKINYLVMTPGVLSLAGREETPEGIDKKMAVHYYARWKFIQDFLPALEKANDEGEKTAVMSVLGAAKGGPIYPDDLPLRKNFSLGNAALVSKTYTDMMMESFAVQSPRTAFLHTDPGVVRTPILNSSTSWILRSTAIVTNTLIRPISITGAECGEYMWSAIYKTATSPGAWRIGSRGEDLKKESYHVTPEQRTAVWEHTAQTIKEAMDSK